jgi:TRAP-type C4-dicarboxylate transport system permease small subunit
VLHMADKKRNFPTFVQAFLITISGAALAFFSCMGFMSNMGRTSTEGFAAVSGIAFAAGVLVLIGGLCLLAFVLIRAIIRAFSAQAPPPADAEYSPSTRYDGTERDSNDPPA